MGDRASGALGGGHPMIRGRWATPTVQTLQREHAARRDRVDPRWNLRVVAGCLLTA